MGASTWSGVFMIVLCVLLVVLAMILAILLAAPRTIVGGAKKDIGAKKKSKKSSDVELYHMTAAGEDYILKILRDGYLRSGRLLRPESSDQFTTPWVHMMISAPSFPVAPPTKNTAILILDPDLLRGSPYYFNLGWVGEITKETITGDGTADTDEVRRELSRLHRNAQKYEPNSVFSHEIFVKHRVPLHRFLKRIIVPEGASDYSRLVEFVTREYPGVKVEKRARML